MHHFEEGVITVAQNSIIDFHDRASPEVMHAIFHFELYDLVQDIFEELAQMFRAFPCLGRVFREIFENGPEVQ